ncbi:GntR family transcriptional regulator [Geodermatophilaceae bacterium NBWT11]|nr:GntR family transcriptional regulator [Geodermatophilaceae bacterium NBWT11]
MTPPAGTAAVRGWDPPPTGTTTSVRYAQGEVPVSEKSTVAEDATLYDRLHAQIVDGQLAPGSVLVEGTLAREYGVSRTPVREALSRLGHEGLIERHERGMRVRVLRPEDVLEIYEVRIALEAAAAHAAALRRTDLDLARLRRSVGEMQALDDEDTDGRPRLAHAFHFGIWAASHNQTLLETLEGVHRRVLGLASTTLHYPERWRVFLAESVELVEAVEARDADRAREASQRQMTNARDFRVQLYSSSTALDDGGLPFL